MKQFSNQDKGIILTDDTGMDWTARRFLELFSLSSRQYVKVPWTKKPLWSIEDTCPFNSRLARNKYLTFDDVYLFRCVEGVRRDFILGDLAFPINLIGIIVLVELNRERLWENHTLNIRRKTGFYWVAKSNLPCAIGVLEAETNVITVEEMIEIVKIPPRVPIIRDYGAMGKMKGQVTGEKLMFANDCIKVLLQLTDTKT